MGETNHTLRITRSGVVHVTNLAIRTPDGKDTAGVVGYYADTHCAALTQHAHRMHTPYMRHADGDVSPHSYNTPEDALVAASRLGPVCARCRKACANTPSSD